MGKISADSVAKTKLLAMSAKRTLPSFVFRTSLTQHSLAAAAHVLLQRNKGRQCGHSWALFRLEPRSSFRCMRSRQARRGLYRHLKLILEGLL